MKLTDREILSAARKAEAETFQNKKPLPYRVVEILQLRSGRLFDYYEQTEALERVERFLHEMLYQSPEATNS